ncbi:MAG: CHAT domain-containing protein [Bryobacteraceae bacterium]
MALAILAILLALPALPGTRAPACGQESRSEELTREAAQELAASRYARAEKLLLCAIAELREGGDAARLARAWNNLGVARLYQQNFVGAYEAFLEAGALGRRLRVAETEASAWSNLATLYGMLQAWPAAEAALARALELMPEGSRYRAALLAQRVRMHRTRPAAGREEFLRLWREAMDEAERQGDWQVQRHLWDELAEFSLGRGSLEEAEKAVANSFRIVTLQRLTDPDSLWMLAGRLRRRQGRAEEALTWLRKAGGAWTGRKNPVSALRLAAEEAKAEAAAHGADAALRVCRQKWPRVLEWRRAVLPDPQVELASDVAMTELADLCAEAALSGRSGSAEAWAVVEQTRALGVLRQRQRIMAARARAGGSAEGAVIVPTAGTPGRGEAAEAADILEEAGHPESLRLLRLTQGRLGKGQALFSFWLGRERSLLWAVTREGFWAIELPRRDVLIGIFREFRKSVEEGGGGGDLAARLYEETFGKAPEAARRQSEWLISADEDPIAAPLAALRMPEVGMRHLGEARALTYVPSALWLLERGRRKAPRALLAVGGLVHNRADARWKESALKGGAGNLEEEELPSLPGSGKEVAAISALWSRRGLAVKRLQGLEATERAVEEAAGGVTDFHFATHVQPAPESKAYPTRLEAELAAPMLIRFPTGEPFLALSLGRDGRRQGLGARDLYRLRVEGARVVLNGCSSGGGVAQRGAGLWSFATAWLAAGANSVVASLWPIDDDGAFFEAYYEALLAGRGPAGALRAAQAAMAGGGGWRARPRYWAAYIHLGKD